MDGISGCCNWNRWPPFIFIWLGELSTIFIITISNIWVHFFLLFKLVILCVIALSLVIIATVRKLNVTMIGYIFWTHLRLQRYLGIQRVICSTKIYKCSYQILNLGIIIHRSDTLGIFCSSSAQVMGYIALCLWSCSSAHSHSAYHYIGTSIQSINKAYVMTTTKASA